MSELASTPGNTAPRTVWQSGFAYRFRTSPMAVLSALVCVLFFAGALLAPWIAPTNPYDLKTHNLLDSRMPPAWVADGDVRCLLGTDKQGAGVLSSVLFGARVSLLVGFASVILSMIIGVALGLASGYFGGRTDAAAMRTAEVQPTLPGDSRRPPARRSCRRRSAGTHPGIVLHPDRHPCHRLLQPGAVRADRARVDLLSRKTGECVLAAWIHGLSDVRNHAPGISCRT